MQDAENRLAGRLEAAAAVLAGGAQGAKAGGEEAGLLQFLGYDDGDTAQADGRVLMLRAAARLRRLFLLPVPDAPGLVFFGGEADPATLSERHEGCPVGKLAGSGLTPQRAFEACVGEGIEYLSQFLPPGAPIETGPIAAGPMAILGDAPDTEVRRFVAEVLAAGSVGRDRAVAWVGTERLSDGATVRFPVDLCYRRRAGEQDFTPPLKLSSGCAAGATLEAATLRALLELIERDAVALWWRGGRRGREVAPDSAAGRAVQQLLARVRPAGMERNTWLLDITTDVGIPAVAALSARPDAPGFAFGFGARLTLADAACAAIFELCQVELGQHVIAARRQESGDAALTESDRRQLRRGTLFDWHRCKLLQPETDGADRADVSVSGLQTALDQLQSHGIAVYRINLTRAELGVPAVRVLAPGLQLEPCEIVGPRLSRMIEKTGGGALHHGGMPIL